MKQKLKTKDDLMDIKITKNTYVIVYTSEGVVGMDYTSNLAQFLEMIVYHTKYSDSFDVYKLIPEVNK